MRVARRTGAVVAVVATVVALAGLQDTAANAEHADTVRTAPRWPGADRTGSVRLAGQVPLAVTSALAGRSAAARVVGRHAAESSMSLNFGLPLRDTKALDALIAQEGRTHRSLTHAEVVARFAPPQAQVTALRSWLTAHGYTITHVDPAGTAIAAKAPTSTVERTLDTRVVDLDRAASTYHGVKVPAYHFFSNTVGPRLPARLGVDSVSGLSNVDRFFTDVQLSHGTHVSHRGPDATHDRTATGYYPSDLRTMYDAAGHGDATGQTVGFTLWGPNETQQAMTLFAQQTGDTAITIDTACKATGNSASTPSTCVNTQVAANHELAVLENGNDNGASNPSAFGLTGSTIETALDMEAAHGMAPGVAEKYYLADCVTTEPAGTGGDIPPDTCNGTDVGLEEAIEDAASDPTLHTVSNSWGYDGETEWGVLDPFRVATEKSLAMGAAAGTTFWFSTGDDGTYFSGFPADSPYVVGVGGTSLFSTADLDPTSTGPTVRSTATTWAAGGSWCSVVESRPAWQTGPAVTAKAPCPGRVVPDISAVADSATGFNTVFSSSAVVPPAGPTVGVPTALAVGGTSLAAPVMNGMAALTQAFLAKQSYPTTTKPAVGFEGPMLYQLGNGANYDRYFYDVDCGNTANPEAGPDGDAAGAGWDPASGFGELDWFHWATGYAIALGATGLTQPTSVATSYNFGCAQTPTNAAELGISMPTATVGYAVGAPAASPWPGIYLDDGAWTATNTFLKTVDGGLTWQPTNSDMLSLACVSATTCTEVGDGGKIRRTTNSGTTWTYVDSPTDKALTSLACPSATLCYAAGDRGVVIKSTDAGATWVYTSTADGNPLYGLACPSDDVCYAVDNYAHVQKTTDGGTSWTLLSTPVTSPGMNIPGSGGPVPDGGLFGITCSSTIACVAVGGFTDDATGVIVTTVDGGATWSQPASNTGSDNYLNGVACSAGTCYAVGRGGTIVKSVAGGAWSKMTSNATVQLTGITCSTATSCVATGQGGLVDVLSGTTWTAKTGQASGNFLAAVTCVSATVCLAAGQQGATLAFNPASPADTGTLQAGGGTTAQMNAISCYDDAHCATVGAGGVILSTSDAGQTWIKRSSGTTNDLNGVSCVPSVCVAVGGSSGAQGAGTILTSTNGGADWTAKTVGADEFAAVSCTTVTDCVAVAAGGTVYRTTDGTNYSSQTSGTSDDLAGVSCVRARPSAPAGAAYGISCYAAGASGTIIASVDGGTTWTVQTSKTTEDLADIACANRYACFASGAVGTVVTTNDGGKTWAQQGNPISGPVTALNPGPTDLTATYSAACSSARCSIGTASAGDIMTTPILTVTVTAGGKTGTAPALTGLAPSNAAIKYSPPGEATKVTGTLSCTTTATASSAKGLYPVTSCSGLSDPGHSVVYDLDASSYGVGYQPQTITFPVIPDKSYGDAAFPTGATASSGLAIVYTTIGKCTVTNGTVKLTGAGTCTITAAQPGTGDYAPATSVSRTFNIAQGVPAMKVGVPGKRPVAGPKVTVGAVLSTPGGAIPSGTVLLSSGNSQCRAKIDAKGLATCKMLMPGGHPVLMGSYEGDANFQPASAKRTVAIARAIATLRVTRTRVTGQRYRLDASIVGVNGLPPGGTVKFTIAGSTCTARIVGGAGSCTVSVPPNTAKPFRIRYSGDSDYRPITRRQRFPSS